jgi:hypothetical protein
MRQGLLTFNMYILSCFAPGATKRLNKIQELRAEARKEIPVYLIGESRVGPAGSYSASLVTTCLPGKGTLKGYGPIDKKMKGISMRSVDYVLLVLQYRML